MADQPAASLKKTPLNEIEKELGGKMVDFGGWELPVQYSGILDEHEAVRTRVGVFDVSHMGEVTVKGPGALSMLQKATCNDVSKLEDGRAQYNGLLYPTAGFVDDILIYRNAPDDYFIVVNASNSDKDYEWFRECAKGFDADVRNLSAEYAQLAIQGPQAEKLLQPMTDVDLSKMKYYRFGKGKVDGVAAIVSRTGYTGEDGFEVYVSPEHCHRGSCARSSTPARSHAGSVRATHCAWKRRWRCTETTSTTPPRRWKRTWDGSSSSTRATSTAATCCGVKMPKACGAGSSDSRWSTAALPGTATRSWTAPRRSAW